MAGRKKDPLHKSFSYAFEGIFTCIRNERNMKIHIMAMIIVIALGIFMKLNKIEWCIITIAIVMVISAELFNTAIETVVDMVSPQKNPQAKLVKDIAAAAVLVLAIGAAVIGIIIFGPKIVTII